MTKRWQQHINESFRIVVRLWFRDGDNITDKNTGDRTGSGKFEDVEALLPFDKDE